jgi:hypothetical protein
MLCTQSYPQKTLYFLRDFNNSPTILTRIVSQIQFSIQNQNLNSADRLGIVFKVHNQTLAPVWSIFSDSHVILQRIVSQI